MDSVISFFVWFSHWVLIAHFVFLMPLSFGEMTDSRIRRQSGHDPEAQDWVLVIAAGWAIWFFALAGLDPDQSPNLRAAASYIAFSVVAAGWYQLRAINSKHQTKA